ncbi:hypothetical protein [Tsukamurella pseudospumae]|uniref:PPE family domain-containing protein n=1 Tax=Tsukamurella pseudospumae TaxID=239498 RepID=A0A137YT45_9ACTN|nr:hypothetical protein [Tsukamurella pseudospumae]KXO89146.1 hypothetical protein AXK61_11060 [Tsukamurella pseudospumae]
MNRKATSIAALAAAAAIAAVPVSGATAATSTPAVVAASLPASAPAASPAAVLKNVAASSVVGAPASSAVPQGGIAPIVVVTDAAVQGAQSATVPAAAASATGVPISIPALPSAVTDILNTAGLPLAGVWQVVQVAQGVYTIWYKMLTSVPNAILTGQWGSVPSLFTKAINDSLTWVTTGTGPKAPATALSSSSTSSAAALPTLTVPSVVTDALNVAAIPVSAAWGAVQVFQTVYSAGYGLLTSVPNAILTGQWGSVPKLITDAINKSVDAVVSYPTTQLASASSAITKLIADLTPAGAVATTGPAVPSTGSAPLTTSSTTSGVDSKAITATALDLPQTGSDVSNAAAAKVRTGVAPPVVDAAAPFAPTSAPTAQATAAVAPAAPSAPSVPSVQTPEPEVTPTENATHNVPESSAPAASAPAASAPEASGAAATAPSASAPAAAAPAEAAPAAPAASAPAASASGADSAPEASSSGSSSSSSGSSGSSGSSDK